MTYEEAKEIITYHKEHAHEFNLKYETVSVDLLDTMIKALEKQIPKTPKIYKEKYMQPDYLCPVCDADVDTEWDCCAGCGQALNWEGVFE